MTPPQTQEVTLIDPQVIPFPSTVVIEPQMGLGEWLTPGLYLAQQIASNSLVRFVGEKVEQEYLQVMVVIDSDPDELLNKIFSIEQEMYTSFKGLRFDIRVQTSKEANLIDQFKMSWLERYKRI